MYIDDSEGASADDLLFDLVGQPVMGADGRQLRWAQAHFDAARAVLERYGWRSAPGKEQPPSATVEALGVEVDVDAWRLRLTQAKRERYAAQARIICAFADQPCERVVFEQLLGRLQFAAQCFPVGRQHMHACWRLARAQFRLRDGAVRTSRPQCGATCDGGCRSWGARSTTVCRWRRVACRRLGMGVGWCMLMPRCQRMMGGSWHGR